MNRTDRLYALVEELRAGSPRSRTAKEMAERVRRYRRPHRAVPGEVPLAVQHAITERRVIEVDYIDRYGEPTGRAIEPVGVMSLDADWYLVGWCRLREAPRRFRLDRICGAVLTDEIAPDRDPERFLEFMPWLIERPAPLG